MTNKEDNKIVYLKHVRPRQLFDRGNYLSIVLILNALWIDSVLQEANLS